MLRAISWLCVGALALSGCGDGTELVETSSAFEQLAATGTKASIADGAEDCTRRVVHPNVIVVREEPCEGVDLQGVAVAAVSDRLAVTAPTRSGPGSAWVFEASVKTVVERAPGERTKVVKKKVRVRSKKAARRTGKRQFRVKRVERTVRVEREPIRRTVHIRCSATEVVLDVFDNHGPVRSLRPDGVSCGTDGRAVQVMVPLAVFVLPGAAAPALQGRVSVALSRRLEDRTRVRDVLDGVVPVRLAAGECDSGRRAGSEVRCPPWSSPSSSAP